MVHADNATAADSHTHTHTQNPELQPDEPPEPPEPPTLQLLEPSLQLVVVEAGPRAGGPPAGAGGPARPARYRGRGLEPGVVQGRGQGREGGQRGALQLHHTGPDRAQSQAAAATRESSGPIQENRVRGMQQQLQRKSSGLVQVSTGSEPVQR